MSEKYTIDGVEYDRYEDIPEKDRALLDARLKLFEDKDGDGTPDIFQAFEGGGESFSVTRRSRIQTEITGKGKDRVIKTTSSDAGDDGNVELGRLIERATGRHQASSQRSRFDKLVIAFLIVLVAVLVLDRFNLLPHW